MTERPRSASSWKAPQTLPDGRVVEYVWTVVDDCGVPVPAGHMRVLVHLTIDGEAAVVPVLLTPEHFAQASGSAPSERGE